MAERVVGRETRAEVVQEKADQAYRHQAAQETSLVVRRFSMAALQIRQVARRSNLAAHATHRPAPVVVAAIAAAEEQVVVAEVVVVAAEVAEVVVMVKSAVAAEVAAYLRPQVEIQFGMPQAKCD